MPNHIHKNTYIFTYTIKSHHSKITSEFDLNEAKIMVRIIHKSPNKTIILKNEHCSELYCVQKPVHRNTVPLNEKWSHWLLGKCLCLSNFITMRIIIYEHWIKKNLISVLITGLGWVFLFERVTIKYIINYT